MHTHSLGIRDEEMRFGYHSVWFSDHVLVTRKLGADSNELCLSGAEPVPNNRLQATANSLCSCVAPAIGGA